MKTRHPAHKINLSAVHEAELEEDKRYPDPSNYPPGEDIYNKAVELEDIDPEDIAHRKQPVEKTRAGQPNEKDFTDDFTGGDLDVPGSELDDEQERVGSEDEENDYYSLGGDAHEDLEEDRAD
jgi:hypothetical protein